MVRVTFSSPDAWGRLKTAATGSGTETFAYDALGREIATHETGTVSYDSQTDGKTYSVTISDSGDLYYDKSGNIVEEDKKESGTYVFNQVQQPMSNPPDEVLQYIYSPQGRLISRQVKPTGGSTTTLYAVSGPDGSVQSITDNTGNVVERYIYDPTGDVQVLTPMGGSEPLYDSTQSPDLARKYTTPLADLVGFGNVGGSQYDWDNFWHGMRYNPLSGLYVAGALTYNPRIGRMMQPGYGSPTSYTWTNDQLSNGIGFWEANTGNFGVAGTYQQSEGVKWTSRGLALIGAVLTGGAGTVWLGGTAAAGLAVATTTYVGAVAGGTIGGAYSEYQGNGFWSGAGTGFDIGMAAGALAPGAYQLGTLGVRAAGGLLLRESGAEAASLSYLGGQPINLGAEELGYLGGQPLEWAEEAEVGGRLVHLTNSEAGALIDAQNGLKGNIYAGPLSNANATGMDLTFRTGLLPSDYQVAIRIPVAGEAAFSKVTPIGILTSIQRLTGQEYTANGILNLTTGAFTRVGANWNQVSIYTADGIFTAAITYAGYRILKGGN